MSTQHYIFQARLYADYSISWLFPQIDAAMHHGGAGTTGASLRGKSSSAYATHRGADIYVAGIPTMIKPWFGDQYFWASRVQRLGVSAI